MEQTPEISIIIPAYKVESYIGECLESIKRQTYTDWECIVVDDGSPDNSGRICDSFANSDKRFRVFHTPNRGLSSARNTALQEARGRYIAFVDSDDWIDPEFLQTLLDLINKYDADVAQVGIMREYVGFSRPLRISGGERVLVGREPFSELMKDHTVRSYVWNKLYRRDIVDKGFPVGRTFEDVYAQSNWFSHVHRLAISPVALYHYRMRKGSILNSNVAQNRLDHFDMCLYRERMMEQTDPETFTARRRSAYLYTMAVNCAKAISRQEKDVRVRDEAIEKISKALRDIEDPGPGGMKLKTWWRARILRSNPAFFGKLMRFVYKAQFDSHKYAASLFS